VRGPGIEKQGREVALGKAKQRKRRGM